MTYEQLMFAHLGTVIPCIFLGMVILIMAKGTMTHRFLGRIYVCLMLLTSVFSIFMHARAGPILLGHFGFIHLFSVLTIVSLPLAVLAARAGRIKTHKAIMTSVYLGAIVFAGLLTLMPGRYLHQLLFEN